MVPNLAPTCTTRKSWSKSWMVPILAEVTTSQSLGGCPNKISRTLPPTNQASWSLPSRRAIICLTLSGILMEKFNGTTPEKNKKGESLPLNFHLINPEFTVSFSSSPNGIVVNTQIKFMDARGIAAAIAQAFGSIKTMLIQGSGNTFAMVFRYHHQGKESRYIYFIAIAKKFQPTQGHNLTLHALEHHIVIRQSYGHANGFHIFFRFGYEYQFGVGQGL